MYALAPSQAFAHAWIERNARAALSVRATLARTITALPATIPFRGSGIVLSGTIGKLCARAHVHVFIDGVETFDRTGLWQNHSMPEDARAGVPLMQLRVRVHS